MYRKMENEKMMKEVGEGRRAGGREKVSMVQK